MECKDILNLLKSIEPEKLPEIPDSLDHVDHIVKTALRGYPELAADHLLNPELRGELSRIIGDIVRQLDLVFEGSAILGDKDIVVKRARSYHLLLEIALNLFGYERILAGFSDCEIENSIRYIENALSRWESIERRCSGDGAPIAEAVVRLLISDMKKVMASNPRAEGMVAVMGRSVEAQLNPDCWTVSFLRAMKKEIESNIYYKLSRLGFCRFGNDYALGLRWLRRLGYVQVSTNPTLAAIAYDDDPSLWNVFRKVLRDEVAKTNPEWLRDPARYSDELAMRATMVALWPNMEVFRPIFFLREYKDGMISYQLNPNVADSVEGSLKDAFKIYTSAQEYFKKYDAYLLWGYSAKIERGRPNIVFKVAGSSPAAIDITRELESRGIGTNNTVTFTVSQEATLIIAKIEGMVDAVKRGVRITRCYETTMGGRLDDHMREYVAAYFVRKALAKLRSDVEKEEALKVLASMVKASIKMEPDGRWVGPTGWGYDLVASTVDEKVELICSRAYIRPLHRDGFAEFLVRYGVFECGVEEARRILEEAERAIGYGGILVSQRVWSLFFSRENKQKWIGYLISKYGLTAEQAAEIMDVIDVLPASKRKPDETLLTLAGNNMTNTEFPDQQMAVVKATGSSSFRLEDYEYSILKKHDEKIIEWLMKWDDFVKAFELTPQLRERFEEVGIDVSGMGERGLQPEEWSSFGSTYKTMRGFRQSYLTFREKVVNIAREVARELSIT
ncbi:MAG: transaldolase family protein [Candidatus Bathyarchaeia archaeon]